VRGACPSRDKTNPLRKAINMTPQLPLRESESKNWDFFFGLPLLILISSSNHDQEFTTDRAAVRVLRSLRRLR
jgi:hypothetical protein